MTLTESGQIVSFLTDLYPSHLLPTITHFGTEDASDSIKAAHLRYRMSIFVDTYFTKVNPLMFKLVGAEHGEPQDKIMDEILRLLETEIEPLLSDVATDGQGPYFAGSMTLTVVEVCPCPNYPILHSLLFKTLL